MAPPPSRDQIEQMAFMAMMDGIIQTSVPCNCSTCKSENKARSNTRQPPKRTAADNLDNSKITTKIEISGTCNHNHSVPELKSSQAKKSTATSAQTKTNSNATTANPARTDKINALLKAENVQAVFEVFNLTSTSKDEKDLATRIQNATKDCKLYQETKDRVLELCDDDSVDLDAVFGLLAKFRYERNMLTTAVIKGNSEREKAFLCIQRVDHLMYMLQDVAKKKDTKGGDVMHKLGDIIMEIHDLAKTPSTLYDEFLDIKEEHFDLLNDHEEMHQKFVDVNSCHEKLHSSHDKLQSEHTKLLKDLSESKKKASTIGALKNDITRLEKAVDKSSIDNSELKKEVERLSSELAKVNALKHENAQLKKKIATLSIPPPPPPVEDSPTAASISNSKKKKGKKALGDISNSKDLTTDSALSEAEIRYKEVEKANEAQLSKVKKAHETVMHELDLAKTNLKQLDLMLRKTEHARDQALEKNEVLTATNSNWKDNAKKYQTERDRLQAESDQHRSQIIKMKHDISELQEALKNTESQLTKQEEVYQQVKEELERVSHTLNTNVATSEPPLLSDDTIRLLRKIKSEATHLARELDDPKSFGEDMYSIFESSSNAVRHLAFEVERDIEEILSVKGSDPINNHNTVPDTVVPFAYSDNGASALSNLAPQGYNPQPSPQINPANTLPPFRPMMPPPGFTEPALNPFGVTLTAHNPYAHPQTSLPVRSLDSPSAPFSRMAEPPGLSANLGHGFNRTIEPPNSVNGPRFNHNNSHMPLTASSPSFQPASSIQNSTPLSNPSVGVIGSRSTSTKLNTSSPSPISTPTPSVGSAVTGTGSATTMNTNTSNSASGGLGNGAVGVDWNMWARSGR